jgi:sugar phosphate isomerase/epimerase
MLTLATKFKPHRPAFETALAAGFQAVEFWLDADLLTRADEIADLASHYPFRYALHFPNGGSISDNALRSAVTLYRQLNCTAVVIHQPMFDRYQAALFQLDPGLDLAIENHVLDLDRFVQWAERSPGLTLDVEHLWMFTLHNAPFALLMDHVERFLEKYANKLQHVHLPGYQPGGEEHQPVHFNEELATQVMTRLVEHGFTKLVVSELDSRFQSLEYLKKDVEMFDRWKKSQESAGV